MKTLELRMHRRWFLPSYTISKFYVENKELCESLEPPVRELKDLNNDGDFDDEGEGKIKNETAILANRYEVVLFYSPNFKMEVPLLLGVKGFSGIEIHPGRSAKDTHACIIPGDNLQTGKVFNTTGYVKLLVSKIREAKSRGMKTYITITEDEEAKRLKLQLKK
jgi:hypothetical protein